MQLFLECADFFLNLFDEIEQRHFAAVTLVAGADRNGSRLLLVRTDDEHIRYLRKLSLADAVADLLIAGVKLCADALRLALGADLLGVIVE